MNEGKRKEEKGGAKGNGRYDLPYDFGDLKMTWLP